MKFNICKKLNDLYKESNKNINYSLEFLLNSIDLNAVENAIKIIEEFKLTGGTVEVVIDENNIQLLRKYFNFIDDTLIERLLWVSILFPEI